MGEKLAVDGGKPVIEEKLPGWPCFDEETIKAAMEPLKTGKVNYWTGDAGMRGWSLRENGQNITG